jgi:hypothetical protein
MSNRDGGSASSRIARELERERRERELQDEARARLDTQDEFRTKDARERIDTCSLKRPAGR